MRRARSRVSVRWQVCVVTVALSMTGVTLVAATHGAGAAILNYTDSSISTPADIASGPDGALWFTNNGSDTIGRIATDGTVSNFAGDVNISEPFAITVGSDSNLWFTDQGNDSIGQVTTDGTIARFGSLNISGPEGITAGPDGNLWFANASGNTIGRITTGGTVSAFVDGFYPDPRFITAGPDGALWYTCGDGSIGRMTTAGVMTNHFYDATISNPRGIAVGADGALWFVNDGNDSIGRITTSGVVSNFADPTISTPVGITPGPDGALWFTNQGNDSIGRITTGGAVSNYSDPSVSGPTGVTAGPDGALWFTNQGNDSIGSLPLDVPGAPTLKTVTSGDHSLRVSFAPGADGRSSTTGYDVSCIGTGEELPSMASGAASPIVVHGLNNGEGYVCSVHADNDVGMGAESALSALVTPSRTVVTVGCGHTSTCAAEVPSTASASAPGQTVKISGVPSAAKGSIKVSTSLGTLGCPAVGPRVHRITKLTDKGFSPRVRLHVTVTQHIATTTSPEQVCFNSEVPFLSSASPKQKKAGTGTLLACKQVGNVAPCVTSSKQVGANIVVKFVVPGGDPRFYVSLPRGRQAWLTGAGTAKIGKRYSVHLEAFGGTAPFHWKVTSGKLPAGLSLNASSGLISGSPSKKGKSTFAVQATDSSRPAQTATLNVPIVVK